MLPEAKLDILLAHHASLEAELLGQVNSEKYVQITRELDDKNRVLAREPHEHEKADLGEHIVVAPRQPHARDRRQSLPVKVVLQHRRLASRSALTI